MGHIIDLPNVTTVTSRHLDKDKKRCLNWNNWGEPKRAPHKRVRVVPMVCIIIIIIMVRRSSLITGFYLLRIVELWDSLWFKPSQYKILRHTEPDIP